MSAAESKPAEKSLADQRVDKILEEIRAMKKEFIEKYAAINPAIPSSENHHWKAEELLKDLDPNVGCVNCKTEGAKIRAASQEWPENVKAREAAIDKILKERATTTSVCEGCGLGVFPEKDQICPACGNKHYRSREAHGIF